jgi:23S rRNA pseudouridine1911/1915/1917 synthase
MALLLMFLWCTPIDSMQNARRRTTLPKPKILFASNHLLVVDKPPGWHSVPNLEPSPKCLLTYLVSQRMGGGSMQDYLKPLHRLDQPCSGVLMFGKTTKAASRIQKQWNSVVQKTYHVVTSDRPRWKATKLTASARKRQVNERSVRMTPDVNGDYTLQCRVVKSNSDYTLLEVETNQGSRHMIRAILSVHGFPIVGDLRYGNTNLPDQSVALHASRLAFSIQLGDRDQYEFRAPLPKSWGTYFGFRDTLTR